MPTVSVTLWTTPLPPPDDAPREPRPLEERLLFEAVLRDPLLREPLLFARLLEPAVVRLGRDRLDAAAERLEPEPERLDAGDLLPPDLELLLLERALGERFVVSAIEPSLSWGFPGITR